MYFLDNLWQFVLSRIYFSEIYSCIFRDNNNKFSFTHNSEYYHTDKKKHFFYIYITIHKATEGIYKRQNKVLASLDFKI